MNQNRYLHNFIRLLVTLGGGIAIISLTCGLTELFSEKSLCILVEFVCISLLISFKNNSLNLICLLLAIINTLQFASFFSTNNYIIPLTVTNLGSYQSLGIKSLLSIVLASLTWFLLITSSFFFGKLKSSKTQLLLFFSFVVLEVCIVALPIHDFFKTLTVVAKELTFQSNSSDKSAEQLSKNFKKIFVASPNKSFNIEGKNIILIFLEGFSNEVIGPRLTPNLERLRSSGTAFKNYYSHTAATFRGIRGQLISGFQLAQGYTEANNGIGQVSSAETRQNFCSRTVESIPSILNDLGYTTIFLSPHSREEALLNFLNCLKFKHSYGSEDFAENQNATDKETFEEIFKLAEHYEREKLKFFFSSYVWGTHHGMDSPDKKYKDGKNPYLNKFYNSDYWLGEFIKKFENSPLFDNTVLIVTSDHSTFPTKEFNKTFRLNKSIFLGQIPLIIYGKNIPEQEIDASYLNSLSLAPTILDLIEPKKSIETHFLGNSLFSHKKSKFANYSAIGFDIFHNDNGTIKKNRFRNAPGA